VVSREGVFSDQVALLALPAQIARADEGGVSFWIPGFFGGLAAARRTGYRNREGGRDT
jgi:hypothetical protein